MWGVIETFCSAAVHIKNFMKALITQSFVINVCRGQKPFFFWSCKPLNGILCWFQTSFLLATLPLRCLITVDHQLPFMMVTALSSHTTLAVSPSSIAPELNWCQLYAICCSGQSGKVLIYYQDTACHLVILLLQAVLAYSYTNIIIKAAKWWAAN